MNEEIPSNGQDRSLLKKIGRAFSANPSSTDEVADILRSAENESIIDASALQIMEGALKVADMQAREIMIPRSQINVIEEDFTLEHILELVIQSQHSRFPVVGESSDDVLGILLAKELLPLLLSGKESFDLKSLLRPATIIPESKRLNILLQEFREQRYHMAIVVDEYGGVSGLLTIEDVLEEIVGEIEDETDEHEAEQIRKIDDNLYSVEAITEIDDFNEFFDLGFSDDEFDTVGGLVVHAFGHLPKIGESTSIENFDFKVIDGDNRKINLLEVSKKAL
ncbi:CBS domain-containing protein [Porticoccaceae bacterium]|jgi:magnesium and cobalt transporter|nr:CBS domain-containing protein [Porticoccaceae bacterium]MDC1477468.1 CBS domain-containing protein [Porticoccaceae bacterium]CAI8329708.1 MAG: Magnesium and cobalt efflux protein CorC [SAR92 bacterium MED-G29]|tara:strand:- start:4906 stop:5745 length:840 start_codon:yes stop_codon:yes gene_type:complete